MYDLRCAFFKEKRAILQRVLTRVKQRYNVAVSEVGHQDVWQRTEIAIVSVSSNRVIRERNESCT